MIIQYLSIAAALFCFCCMFIFFLRCIRLGKPNDLSEKSGDTTKGIVYANTVAMMPQNKESAYLHIPGYASGMLFHIGTFISFLIFVLSFFPFFNQWIKSEDIYHLLIPTLLIITALCGYALLLRRILSKDLKALSNADDYISNFLTSSFQLATLLYLFMPQQSCVINLYYIACILLFLYLPLGKLRHLIFYFAARYHLGFFYGWRNVWPNNEK